MHVQELARGLWRWTAPYLEWTPDQGGTGGWEREVGCLLCETDEALVLVDPLAPAEGSDDAERFWAALDRDVARHDRPVLVLITIRWHLRDAAVIRGRYGARPGVRVLALDEVRRSAAAQITERLPPGAPLPGGIELLGPVPHEDGTADTLVHLPAQRTLSCGDILAGTPEGLRVWWPGDPAVLRERALPMLRRALAWPLERVVPSHGAPVLRDGQRALEHALASPPWR